MGTNCSPRAQDLVSERRLHTALEAIPVPVGKQKTHVCTVRLRGAFVLENQRFEISALEFEWAGRLEMLGNRLDGSENAISIARPLTVLLNVPYNACLAHDQLPQISASGTS